MTNFNNEDMEFFFIDIYDHSVVTYAQSISRITNKFCNIVPQVLF